MTGTDRDWTARLREICDAIAVREALPSYAFSLRSREGEIASSVVEYPDAKTPTQRRSDTRYGVASVTKVLTATLIMCARQMDLINLSDPVSRFFPDLQCARDGKMRLHHLLSHSAGLPGLPFRHKAGSTSDADPIRPMRTAADLVQGINALDVEMLAPPGECLSYSNEGYCLLGGIIEDLFGCTYGDAAAQHVFRPLHMDSSVIGAVDAARDGNLATPLQRTDSGLRTCGLWDAPLFDPAGGLVVSAGDMTRLISILAGRTSVLDARAASDMISASLPVASRPFSNARYGLGLEIRQLDAGHTLAWHSGQRPGISSFVGHVMERDLSVAFVTNVADAPAAAVGHRILGEVLQDDVEPGCCVWPPPAAQVKGLPPDLFEGRFSSQELGMSPSGATAAN